MAVKTMHVLGAGRGGRHRSRSIMRSLLQEVEVLSRCRHPNGEGGRVGAKEGAGGREGGRDMAGGAVCWRGKPHGCSR